MQGYYFLYSIIALTVCFILVRYFVLRKKSSAMQLFMEATKAENQGNYQEAIDTYENALFEVKKNKLDHYLKTKIVEKLKVLQTIKTYKSDQAFVRKNNSWIG